ncbi:hypothetical protein Ac2012v2_008250 [Leucoagaricus gongylophorus]
MAFRAISFAKHTRIPTTRASKVRGPPRTLYLRPFSCTPIKSSSQQLYPIDSLVADAIQTENQLEASPPPKKLSKKEILEQSSPTAGLPPEEHWGKLFTFSFDTRGRSFIMNSEVAKSMADSCVPEGTKDQTIVEAFPGPGVLTRALLDLPKDRIKKLIVLEDVKTYLHWLKPLEALDPRLTVIPISGYHWDAYECISAQGLLDDVQPTDWSQEHSQLKFISHVSDNVYGEQIVSQFLRCIPDRGWLFKYGRVPLNLFMTNTLWQRISDPPGAATRCKLSVIAEGTASADLAFPPTMLMPYRKNFYPPGRNSPEFLGISIIPLKEPVIEGGLLDDWDYVLRRLFVQRATPVARSIPTLAPGAATLLKKVAAESIPPDQRLNTKLSARKLSAQEWKILVKAFADWPFKPDNLSIDGFQVRKSRQEDKSKFAS